MKAFPTHSINVNDEARVTAIGGEGGMNLRDYFAAMAMQGLLAQQAVEFGHTQDDAIVKNAYSIANAMMEERDAHDD